MITTLKVLFLVKKFKFFFCCFEKYSRVWFLCVCMCGCAIFKTIFNVYPFIVVEKSEFFFLRFNILLYVFLVCLMSISNFTQSPLFFPRLSPKKNLHDYRFFQWIIGSFVSVSLSSSLCPWIIVSFFWQFFFLPFFCPIQWL